MFRSVSATVLFAVVTFASSVLASSQVMPSQTDASVQAPASSSVTFVYVSSQKGSNYEVSGYSAASNGQLTAISGSPFPANANYLALNSKYLFGSNGIEIYSFSIASDGALTQVASINAQNYNQNECGGPENLFVDRTGTTLYDPDFLGNICAQLSRFGRRQPRLQHAAEFRRRQRLRIQLRLLSRQSRPFWIYAQQRRRFD